MREGPTNRQTTDRQTRQTRQTRQIHQAAFKHTPFGHNHHPLLSPSPAAWPPTNVSTLITSKSCRLWWCLPSLPSTVVYYVCFQLSIDSTRLQFTSTSDLQPTRAGADDTARSLSTASKQPIIQHHHSRPFIIRTYLFSARPTLPSVSVRPESQLEPSPLAAFSALRPHLHLNLSHTPSHGQKNRPAVSLSRPRLSTTRPGGWARRPGRLWSSLLV